MIRLLVVDTETGGLSPLIHSVLSVAAVVWEDGVIRDSIQILVNEGESLGLDPEAMAVNRLDVRTIQREGLKPSVAVTVLHQFVDRHFSVSSRIPLVGHNVGFDVSFLKRLYWLADVDFDARFSHRVLDTASIVSFLSLIESVPLRGASSTEVFEYFGIVVDADVRHTALGDALGTASLLTRLIGLARSQTAPRFFGSLSHPG